MISEHWPLALAAILGFIGWTLAEYLLHRFAGHEAKGQNLFKREHLAHHRSANYFAPAHRKLAVALIVSGLMIAALSPILGLALASAFTAGFALSYALYEAIHYSLHASPPRGPYSRWARRHHFTHHFASPRHNHGVTSSIWDRVFGTLKRVERIDVPAFKAMHWLRDEHGQPLDAVPEAYAADYRLVSKPSKEATSPTP